MLLHIGTNGLDRSPDDVADILDEIDAYETANSVTVWVILARIINRNCIEDSPPCSQSGTTTDFNDNVEDMALDRKNNSGNPAYPDKIVIVDMEDGAGIDYRLQPVSDMWDNLHPFETGYAKMADLWFTGLMQILPQADAGNPQTMKERDRVSLDGSNSSDPDGTIASYLWEQLPGGTPVQLSGAPTDTATFTAPDVAVAGETLTFKLTVTDNDGLTSTDTVKVEVSLKDKCPNDPNKTQPGICGCSVQDIDTDDDGALNCIDNCPDDPGKIEPGSCGCGIADVDTDGDNTFDCLDKNFDDDGVPDIEEQGPAGNDPNYDGNDDGVADRLQNNITAVTLTI